jgi:hypothetical protein
MAHRAARPDRTACHNFSMNPMPLPFRPFLTCVPRFARIMAAGIQ